MATEEVDPRFADLDAWPLASAMEAMWEGQLAAVASVGRALPAISAATHAAKEALRERGRLIYVGAGTSARVAIQDGAELKPTFGWPRERLHFIIAGGESAFVTSVEGAEDDVADAVKQVDAARLSEHDVVIAVSASGTTPFTDAALRESGTHGAVTIGVASNPGAALLTSARYSVLIETGRELVAGSTRMKAGTAQKVVLNLISTGIMLGLGCVYRGMMVDMQPTNAKLKRRAEDMVRRITGCSETEAARALEQTAGNIKTAALLTLGHDRAEAEAMLARHQGNLRHVLADRGG
jgi:N-acetylmuramic acid 6-phosphate etherase